MWKSFGNTVYLSTFPILNHDLQVRQKKKKLASSHWTDPVFFCLTLHFFTPWEERNTQTNKKRWLNRRHKGHRKKKKKEKRNYWPTSPVLCVCYVTGNKDFFRSKTYKRLKRTLFNLTNQAKIHKIWGNLFQSCEQYKNKQFTYLLPVRYFRKLPTGRR